MMYEDGYPEPVDSPTVNIEDTTFAPGDQFRFPIRNDPISGEPRYGLCYVYSVEDSESPKVTFFNVTEEARTTHTLGELRGALERGELTKLDEKWGEK